MIDKSVKASKKVGVLRIFRKVALNLSQSRWAPNRLRVRLLKWGGVNVGKNIFLGEGVVIDTIRPDLLTIGDNTLITARCMILTHFYKNGNFYYGDVKIGSGCFIGMNTIIANSVTIGDNSVIGAGSIVTKDIPAGEVWAGNPAKFIKKRI
jgi:acetyltransferase-like isoleucine patch superfamily enzyme